MVLTVKIIYCTDAIKPALLPEIRERNRISLYISMTYKVLFFVEFTTIM